MNAFIKQYRELCKELLNKLHFQRKGSTFYRIINDVFQTVSIENSGTYSFGTQYRICFGTVPLAAKKCFGDTVVNLDCGHYSLKKFEVQEKAAFVIKWICRLC